jgi:hypothetical protein
MGAQTLLIIRHAEKPEGPDDPGLDEVGRPDERSLALKGWQRAGAWAALFGAGLGGSLYPVPRKIYAADPERAVEGRASRRMFQTILPLAARLRIEPGTHFAKGEELQLAEELRGFSGIALVCWEHALIPKALLPALLQDQRPQNLPGTWDKARYDVVLRLDREAPTAPWSLRQFFPRLMAGDSDRPLA